MSHVPTTVQAEFQGNALRLKGLDQQSHQHYYLQSTGKHPRSRQHANAFHLDDPVHLVFRDSIINNLLQTDPQFWSIQASVCDTLNQHATRSLIFISKHQQQKCFKCRKASTYCGCLYQDQVTRILGPMVLIRAGENRIGNNYGTAKANERQYIKTQQDYRIRRKICWFLQHNWTRHCCHTWNCR